MNNKYELRDIIVGFCLPTNFIILLVGIYIGNPFAIVLACLSTGLILLPHALEDPNEEKDEEQKKKD